MRASDMKCLRPLEILLEIAVALWLLEVFFPLKAKSAVRQEDRGKWRWRPCKCEIEANGAGVSHVSCPDCQNCGYKPELKNSSFVLFWKSSVISLRLGWLLHC